MSGTRSSLWAVVALVTLAAGCRSWDPAPGLPLRGLSNRGILEEPPRHATFDCDGGFEFVIAVPSSADVNETVDLVLPAGRQRLPRVPTASGARYSAGSISVWNKGREAILDLDGQVYKCREATLR